MKKNEGYPTQEELARRSNRRAGDVREADRSRPSPSGRFPTPPPFADTKTSAPYGRGTMPTERRQAPQATDGRSHVREAGTQRKKSLLFPILSVLLLLALVVGGVTFLLKTRGDNGSGVSLQAARLGTEEERDLRLQVNQYRVVNAQAQNATLKLFEGLNRLADSFIGNSRIPLRPEAPNNPFVSNAEDWKYEEIQHPTTMGRLGIPSIGTDGPLSDDCTEATLYYGFGLFPEMKYMDEEGMTVILGHRILTKRTGMYFMNEMKEGDPFYVDDFRTGKRYIYKTKIHKYIPGDEQSIISHVAVADGHELVKGKSCLLVTCHPLYYNSSEERILVYGEQIKVVDVPEDDPWYLDWKQVFGG